MPQTLVVIPARMASSRFPGKILAPVGGKTLIQLVCEQAGRLPGVAGPLVATDDPRIRDHVRALGYEARLSSKEHACGTDRVAEAAADWPGLILNLQGDEPLFDPGTVSALIARLEADSAIPMGTAACLLGEGDLENSDRVKVLRDAAGFAVDFTRRLGDELPDSVVPWRHAGVYLFRPEVLKRFAAAAPGARERTEGLEQLRALALGISLWVEVGGVWGPGVDRPEDLKVVAKLLGGL